MIPDLCSYDIVLINTSAGKDSQAMLDEVARLATAARFSGWMVAVHADLGRVEWAGTLELAAKQVGQYDGIRFETVSRPQGDLIMQFRQRRVRLDVQGDVLTAEGRLEEAAKKYDAPAFPSSKNRYCTSDQKTSQVVKLITQLVDEFRSQTGVTRRVRVLNCLGLRAQESSARAKKVPFGPDNANWSEPPSKKKGTPGIPHGKREVHRWLPIFEWTEDEVWARIKESGVPYHPAYDLGMRRLSCIFCVFASKADLTIAAKHNPELAKEYVAVEIETRSRFKENLSMAEIIRLASANTFEDLAA